jgi:hypothetical protein
VFVTLLSIADAWKEMLIPCQNGSIDLKDCIMPFMMHSAMLPFQQGTLYWKCIAVSPSFAHNEVSCSDTDFLYNYHDPGFPWKSILVLSIYQVNSVDDLTCKDLVMGWLGFPHLEPLPRSATNFKISNSSCLL